MLQTAWRSTDYLVLSGPSPNGLDSAAEQETLAQTVEGKGVLEARDDSPKGASDAVNGHFAAVKREEQQVMTPSAPVSVQNISQPGRWSNDAGRAAVQWPNEDFVPGEVDIRPPQVDELVIVQAAIEDKEKRALHGLVPETPVFGKDIVELFPSRKCEGFDRYRIAAVVAS